jgi:hypothetical protein
MRLSLALFLVLHGLIHLLGFAKAYRLAELPQLTRPIPPLSGVLWLAAAVLFVSAATALFVWPRWWWAVGAAAVAVSMVAIVPSWTDAKVGALANLVVIMAVVFGFLAYGPSSLRADYERDVDQGLSRLGPTQSVTEADLAHLPEPVQRYLRTAGVVGQPRVQNVRARMHGRIRSGPAARWMPFDVEQYNFFDQPSRFFYMNASMRLVPVQGYHRYAGSSATMLVKAAALVPVAQASGPEMDRAETVTLFNDMCLLAPATLVDPGILWEAVDGRTARGTFTNAGQTIQAELSFNDAGELTNFWSDDRRQLGADRQTLRPVRWSTPIGRYRSFGAHRIGTQGEGRWHEPGGEYIYIELEIDEVEYNVRP